MTEYELARLLYAQACGFADEHNLPRTAVAKAQFHSAMQIFGDEDGADTVADWLERESKTYREVLESYRGMFERGGRC